MKRGLGVCALAIAAAAVTIGFGASVAAHKTAVSPYTFYRDVAPIIDARCARCHGDGSPSGLSLLRYDSARGSIWPMRQALISGHMPPWFAEGPFTSPPPLTARELNVLMTWSTGGAPEGALTVRPPVRAAVWPLGPPDLIVPMPSPFAFATEQGDQVHEVLLPSARIGGRVIRAVDLLPGTPAIVRSAEIIARSGTRDQVLGLWQPGEVPSRIAVDAGFHVAPGARLLLRIRYRRLFGSPASDRSQAGIYFAGRAADSIDSLELTGEPGAPTVHRVTKPIRAVALRPVSGASGTSLRIDVLAPDGSRKALARLQLEADWARRYAFEAPVSLAAGSTIEVSVVPTENPLWTSLTAARVDGSSAPRVALEFVK